MIPTFPRTGMDAASRVGRRVCAACLLLAVFVVASALVGGATGSLSQDDQASVAPGFAGSVDADDVLLAVDLRPDGTADWRVEYRIRLADDNDTEAFESLRAEIREDPASYRERFAAGIHQTVSDAENATSREMDARNFAVETDVRQLPQEYGVVSYTFVWTNFATTDGEAIHAGDALAGLFLDDATALQFNWPAEYVRETASPQPTTSRDRAVSWSGPISFAEGEPRLVVAPTTGAETAQTGTTGTGGTASPSVTDTTAGESAGDGSAGGLPSWLLLAGLGLVAAPIVGLWIARQRSSTEQVADAESSKEGAQSPEEPEDDSHDSDDRGPPEELLSNEERVLKLLDERGGRIKQQEVVETLGWTDAKTSQVVGKLREEDEIEVFRLGRENVLTLPGEGLR